MSSDCFLLSHEIQEKTDKRVSETTLKRFFGFTSGNHNPSQYTLDALSEYCDFTSWNHFKRELDALHVENSAHPEWHEIKVSLSKTSEFNLNIVRRKTPDWNDKLLSRPWVHKYFNRFEHAPFNVALLHAPAAYGKTLAICKWLEEKLSKSASDIVLYTNSLSLFQSAVYGFNPHRWLANVFELTSPHSLDLFLDRYKQSAPGFLHVVIDDVNEEVLNERQYYAVLNNVFDMINQYSCYDWLKFTLIVRTNIFEKLKKKITRNNQKHWYLDKHCELLENFKFSTIELSFLLNKNGVDHNIGEIAVSTSFQRLRTPINLEHFTKLRESNPHVDFRFDEVNYFLVYEMFLCNETLMRLFHQSSAEHLRELVIGTPVQEDRHSDNVAGSHGRKLPVYMQWMEIFDELIGQGIMIQDSQEGVYFADFYFKGFLIAYTLYHKAEPGVLNHHARITELLSDDAALAKIVSSWILFFQIEDLSCEEWLSEKQDFGDFLTADETLYYTTAFAAHLYNLGTPDYQVRIRDAFLFQGSIFKIIYFSGLSYTLLKRSIMALLQLGFDRPCEFQLRLSLAVFAFMRWDEELLIKQLETMAELQESVKKPWSVDPARGLSALYNFIKYDKVDTQLIPHLFNRDYVKEARKYREDEMFAFEFVGYLLLLLHPDREVAGHYLKTINHKLSRVTDDNEIGFFIYYFLSKLVGPQENSALFPEQDPVYHRYLAWYNSISNPNLLQILTHILVLHIDFAYGVDYASIKEKTDEIESRLEPLGYRVLNKYYAVIATRNGCLIHRSPVPAQAQS